MSPILARCAAFAFGLALGAAGFAHDAQGQAPARATTDPAASAALSTGVIAVQDIARIQGQGESVLRGIGIVTGLRATGDDGADLLLARPLAKIYEANGNPLPDLKELAKSKSAAMVFIECTIPEQGARADDKLDVQVTVSHSAKSLQGGRLHLAALSGPMPGAGVYAMASGPIVLDDTQLPTVGRVRLGAHVIKDILMPSIKSSFTLIIKPSYRNHATASMLAQTVNSIPGADADGGDVNSDVAHAIDDVTVRVDIPAAERTSPTRFIGKVMSATFSPSLLRLPARVVCNERSGIIVVTGNVEVSPVVIAHKDLVITTINPPPVPTPVTPISTNSRVTSIATTGRTSERTRVQDLLSALKALDVPVMEQIKILVEIDRAGRLHGQLVLE
jgi:flagellar P-ring protein precursor FlgI